MDGYAALLYNKGNECSTGSCEKSSAVYSGVYNSNNGTAIGSQVYTATIPITFEESITPTSLFANDPDIPATTTITTADIDKDALKLESLSGLEIFGIVLLVLVFIIAIIGGFIAAMKGN